jgi:hypothetical protein
MARLAPDEEYRVGQQGRVRAISARSAADGRPELAARVVVFAGFYAGKIT